MENGYYNHNQSSSDIEKTVGKSVMAIAASLLIIISLIMFATLLIPGFTDTVKMVLMFTVSSIITIVGLILVIKFKSKGYVAILACGVSALYVSLMVSTLYFQAINVFVFGILISAWTIAIALMSRFQSLVFIIIGQIGVCFSTGLSILYFWKEKGDGSMIMLVSCFAFSEILFIILEHKESFTFNLCNYVPISMVSLPLALAFSVKDILDRPLLLIAAIIFSLFLLAIILMLLLGYESTNSVNTGKGIVALLNAIILFSLTSGLKIGEEREMIITLLIIAMQILIIIISEVGIQQNNNVGKILLQIGSFGFLTAQFSSIQIGEYCVVDYVLFLPIALIAGIIGICRNKRNLQIVSIVLLGISVLPAYEFYSGDAPYGSAIIVMFLAVIMSVTGIILLKRKSEKYNSVIMILYYVFGAKITAIVLDSLCENIISMLEMKYWISIIVSSIIVGGITFLLSLWDDLCVDERTGKVDKAVVVGLNVLNYYIVCKCLMYSFIMNINARSIFEKRLYQITFIVIALWLLTTNDGRCIRGMKENSIIYVCIKLYIFAFFACLSTLYFGPVMSSSCLTVAVICIVVGFKYNSKVLRLLGLIVSLMNVGKLIIFDIHYNSPIIRACSFLICGIICLIISIIYNEVGKKVGMNQPQKESVSPVQVPPVQMPVQVPPVQMPVQMPQQPPVQMPVQQPVQVPQQQQVQMPQQKPVQMPGQVPPQSAFLQQPGQPGQVPPVFMNQNIAQPGIYGPQGGQGR